MKTAPDKLTNSDGAPLREGQLAINGGAPVRGEPLPLEFPGIHRMGEEEINAAVRVLRSRSLFRYYGIDLSDVLGMFITSGFAVVRAESSMARRDRGKH